MGEEIMYNNLNGEVDWKLFIFCIFYGEGSIFVKGNKQKVRAI